MKIRLLFLILYILIVCLMPQDIHPCTIFCLDKGDQLLVGFNFDWFVDDGFVCVNKRNVTKTAFLLKGHKKETDNPLRWTSKFGSVTFGVHEFPIGGMNETGLVIFRLALMKSKYPVTDTRPVVSQPQWTQHHLDNCSTIDEVLASDKQIWIPEPELKRTVNGHYFLCDRTGNCAVIEFLDGKLTYHTKETLPVKALANITYRESIEFWKEGKLPTPNPGYSAQRFVAVADMTKKYNVKNSKPAVDYAFDMLTNVSQGTIEEIDGVRVRSPLATVWNIVFDIKNLRIYLRTFENPKIRYINVNSFDFSCKTPVKVLDIQAELSGDVTSKFIDYNYKLNRELFKKINVFGFSDEQEDIHGKYPETTICTEVIFTTTIRDTDQKAKIINTIE